MRSTGIRTQAAGGKQPLVDRRVRRAWWLKTLYQWHWISSAVCLFGMLLFSITGITLNHSGAIEAKPRIVGQAAVLPDALLQDLASRQGESSRADEPLPDAVAAWVGTHLSVNVRGRPAEWSEDEVYLALPRPGGDAWLLLDLQSGEAEYELTDRGWIAWFNDLHKGRHTGLVWSWFIDIFAVACLVFSITGLLILQVRAADRPAVWPMVGLGVVVPLLIMLLFIH